MPIEFRCSQCGKLLRTGDDTAGKQARCPSCETVMTIPSAPAAAAPGDAGPPPIPGATPGSPFAGQGPQPAAGDPENPYQAPSQTSFTPAPGTQPQQPGGITPSLIDLGDVFNRTWIIFKREWGMCLVGVILVGLMNFGSQLVVNLGTAIIGAAAGDQLVAALFSFVGSIGVTAFQMWIGIGQAIFFLKIARGQEASPGDLFTGGPFFWPVLGSTILIVLIYLAGLMLCLSPGIVIGLIVGWGVLFRLVCGVGAIVFVVAGAILSFMLSQYYYLIVDRRAGAVESLGLSKEITTGNKLMLFLIGLVGILLFILACIPCGLGLIVAIPFFTLMWPVIYLSMTGQPIGDQQQMGY